MVATLRHEPLAAQAPEVLQRRGIFGRVSIEALDRPATAPPPVTPEMPGDSPADRLAAAFREQTAPDRLRACVAALDAGRAAPRAGRHRQRLQEVNDLESAARDLDEAIASGTRLGRRRTSSAARSGCACDDMEAAARASASRGRLLPGFGAAWGNLGATLGELDRPAEALAAFERLLALDPVEPPGASTTSGSSAASWAGWRSRRPRSGA